MHVVIAVGICIFQKLLVSNSQRVLTLFEFAPYFSAGRNRVKNLYFNILIDFGALKRCGNLALKLTEIEWDKKKNKDNFHRNNQTSKNISLQKIFHSIIVQPNRCFLFKCLGQDRTSCVFANTRDNYANFFMHKANAQTGSD